MGATIRDIAKAANVSTNTVSRALNGKSDIKKETRERILAVARELDYVPNMLARSLLHRRSGTIGVVVTDNSNPFYARLLRGIEDCTTSKGYNIILCNSDENVEREAAALRTLKEKRVDGILITPASTGNDLSATLTRSGVPFVLLNRTTEDAGVDYVKTDNIHGARLAMERLLSLGRRKLCYLGGPTRISSAVERLQGCRDAIRDAGLVPETLIVVETNLRMEDGYAAMRGLLAHGATPDGLFAFSDIIAVGAMKAIREAGLSVPKDIAVVGYDDIEIASFLEVGLTTVHQERYELGWKAAEILIQRLADPDGHQPQHFVSTPELILRDSA
jgi:LacI family transcriptional regulator